MKFLPTPGTRIADLLTFHDGFHADYELYGYKTGFVSPRVEDLQDVFSALDKLDPYFDLDSHYVIHQNNASWIGSGFEEYKNQIFNQRERYRNVPDEFDLDTYKYEITVCILPLPGGGYIVLSANPSAHREAVDRFEVRLILDGLQLNNSALDPFLEESELEFYGGQKVDLEQRILNGSAVEGRNLGVKKVYRDDYGDITKVLCENPFYNRGGLVNRIFSHRNNILSNYKYVIADCESRSKNQENAEIWSVSVTNYDSVVQHTAQNIDITVTLG